MSSERLAFGPLCSVQKVRWHRSHRICQLCLIAQISQALVAQETQAITATHLGQASSLQILQELNRVIDNRLAHRWHV